MAFVPKASLLWRLYRRCVRTQVEYFAVPKAMPRADVLKLCDLPQPYPGVANEHRPTIVIDLTTPEEELWSPLSVHLRKVIRQSRREGVAVERLSELGEADWQAFLAAYWKLWQRKGQAGALGIGQIGELVAKRRFVLTRSRDPEGRILSWHAYVLAPKHVRLHTTISDMDPARGSRWNNYVGRAHRLHHWQDMMDFKAEGVETYDFGGVYRGTEDKEQVNIAHFKQLFGGRFADTYDAVLPLTLKGRLALSLVSLIGEGMRSGGPGAAAQGVQA
jgi:hypothetical protein